MKNIIQFVLLINYHYLYFKLCYIQLCKLCYQLIKYINLLVVIKLLNL